MIALTCPTCGEPLQEMDDQAGKATRCRECGEPLRLPGQRFRHEPPRPAPAPPAPKPERGRVWAGAVGGVVGALAGLGAAFLFLTLRGAVQGPLRVPPRGAWTVHFRPAWVGEWPAGENVRESDEIERVIEQRLQDGTFTSVWLRPNVLVLGEGVWERSAASEREAFLTLFAEYFDLKGFGSRYEIRAPVGGGQPGKLLATYSREVGLRPVRDN
ncbi:MAG TPA: hypothetical protein VFE78_23905 [Gemmataceae bacterium]|jgi:hypothetical protein|nr:hypothetical protein [Gemmataceae bacterium]